MRYGRSEWVHTLLTLGTPHQSVEAHPLGKRTEQLWGPAVDRAEAAVQSCVLRSSLQFANFCYPDAASLGDVRVVTACGNAIRGRPLWGAGSSISSGDCSTDSSWLGTSSYASCGSDASCGSVDGASAGQHGSRWDAYVAYQGYKVRGRPGKGPACLLRPELGQQRQHQHQHQQRWRRCQQR